MSKQTGGDFLGGVPKECFESRNPCAQELTDKSAGSDTSHLSNARALQQATSPAGQIRHGWHPNLNNLKG